MSLILMEGFETRKTFQDWQNRANWVYCGVTATQQLPTFPTSRAAGEGGSGFQPQPTSYYSYGYYPSYPGAGAFTWAYNPNLTVNQAWLQGGMTMGFSARMTSSTIQQIGTTFYYAGNNCCVNNMMCFDGTYYYALQHNSSTNVGIVRSKDLIHWTLTAQPVGLGGINQYTSIAYVNGAVAVIGTATTAPGTVYYSTDQGNNWKSYQLTASTPNPIYNIVATGNPTYPVLIFGSHGGPFYCFVGSWAGGFTQVWTQASGGPYYFCNRPKVIGNTIICPCNNTSGGNSVVYTANINSNLSLPASWTANTIPISYPSDWAYNPVTNLWNVSSHVGGIWMIPASGTPTAPLFPSVPDCVVTSSQIDITNLVWNGTQMVAIGLNGAQLTSTDSRNFYPFATRQILPEGTASDWTGCYYDGTRYILTTDNTVSMIVTTPDLVNDYQIQFIGDLAPSSAAAAGYWANAGFFPASGVMAEGTAWTTATGAWHTPNTGFNICSMGLNTSGQLQLVLTTHIASDGSTNANQQTIVAVNSDTNYFELQMVPAATSNTFMFYLYVNGALVAQSLNPLAMATAGNTTAQMYCFPLVSNGTMTMIDDLYITLNDGKGVSGRLGPCTVVARRPSVDVQANFARVGDRATNSLTLNQGSAKSRFGDFLTSTQTNQADVYTSSDTIQAKSTVRAVQVEASVRRLTTQSASALVGLISNNTQVEHDSAVTNIAGPVGNLTPVVGTFQSDPDGNNWTLANTLAAKLTINHTN